jgi:hypothetical protein
VQRIKECTVLFFVLAGCTCAGKGAADAGHLTQRASDLHTALELVFPEYRGVKVLKTTATLTRRLEPFNHADLERAKAQAVANGFSGDPLTRPPFTMTLEEQGNALTMQLVLPIREDEIGRIFSAPAAMSSETMAHWLPTLSSPIARETFEFEVEWEALKPGRAAFLNWQLVDGALRSNWQPQGLPAGYQTDAGKATVPDPFKVTLVEPSTQGRLSIDRAGEHAVVRYTLVTREP